MPLFNRKPTRKYRSREYWSNRLQNYPALRLLVFDPVSRIGFGVMLVGALVLWGMLSKRWNATPSHVQPPILISGLDRVQCWSLQRSARAAFAAGDWETARHCWRSALANDPGSLSALRGMLSQAAQAATPGPMDPMLVGAFGPWLLQLTHTNLADLELVLTALHHVGNHAVIPSLLAPSARERTPTIAAVYQKALFETGRYSEVGPLLRGPITRPPGDPDLDLYQLAFQAGWMEGGTATAARRGLELGIAESDPARSRRAARLGVIVGQRLGDPTLQREALQRLEALGAARVYEHADYWLALAASGRREEAVKLATASEPEPGTVRDALALVRVQSRLGLTNRVEQTFEFALKRIPGAEPIWIGYAEFLANAGRWKDLVELVWRIRADEGVRDGLDGYSYFLEYVAENALGRTATAEGILETLPKRHFPNPLVGLSVANALIERRQQTTGARLLDALEPLLGLDAAYWSSRFGVAVANRDWEALRRSAERAFELSPGDPMVQNNYAAVLLIARERPDLSMRLLFDLRMALPQSGDVALNHVLALLQNERTAEAARVLSTVVPDRLGLAQRNAYFLAQCELALQAGDAVGARAAVARMDPGLLWPPQQAWLRRQGLMAEAGR